MAKTLRKSLLALLFAFALVCTVAVTIQYARPASADVVDSAGVADVADNWLVDKNKNPYSVPNHVFGDVNFSVDAPRTYYTGEGGDMKIKLSIDGKTIVRSGFGVSNWSYYINSAMPAGAYSLEITVDGVDETVQNPDYPGDPSKTIQVHHDGFAQTVTFTVEKAILPSLDEVYAGLNGKSFQSDITGSVFYNRDTGDAVKDVDSCLAALSAVDRSGTYWEARDDYYSDFAIEFNLLLSYSEKYKSISELLPSIASPATYKVYYRISAKNYLSSTENLVDETPDAYYFTLIRYEVLPLPTIEDRTASGDLLYVYTGYDVLPKITGNDLYEISWIEGDGGYTSGGTHQVQFKLTDNVHYRWKGIDGNAVSVKFTIGQATNWFTASLNFIGWSYESFDAMVNNIRAIPKFLDEGEKIYFGVTNEDGTPIDGKLDKFNLVKDETTGELTNRVDSEIAELLKVLPTGTYTLHAWVEATGNYKKLEDETNFTVSKAINTWKDGDDDLKLPNWIVGKYDPDENPIEIKAIYGTVNVIITDIYENEYYNSTTGLNKLNDCKVGKYLLKAWVEESDNYAALERTFTIEVFDKEGLPWWVTLVIVVGSLGIAALIIFILWKKGVFRIVTDRILLAIRTRVSVEATIASVRAAKMMEEGRKSVEAAKRKERLEQAREKQRNMTPEERAAQLEAKAQADAARAERLRAKSEADLAKVEKMRQGNAETEEKQEAASNDGETPAEE